MDYKTTKQMQNIDMSMRRTGRTTKIAEQAVEDLLNTGKPVVTHDHVDYNHSRSKSSDLIKNVRAIFMENIPHRYKLGLDFLPPIGKFEDKIQPIKFYIISK